MASSHVVGTVVRQVMTQSGEVPVQQLLAEMVMDKESKMKIVQLINGVPLWLYWMSYLLQFLIIAMPTSATNMLSLPWLP